MQRRIILPQLFRTGLPMIEIGVNWYYIILDVLSGFVEMLALTKKTDYALIALTELAGRSGALASARELAASTRVPLPMLTNILKVLAHSGIVMSERGASGGYKLARSTDSINLDEVLSAVEGPFQFVQCSPTNGERHGPPCELTAHCRIRKPAQRIHGRLKQFLRNVTLAELVDEPRAGDAVDIDIRVPLRQAAN